MSSCRQKFAHNSMLVTAAFLPQEVLMKTSLMIACLMAAGSIMARAEPLSLFSFTDGAAATMPPAAAVARVRSTGLDPATLPVRVGQTYVMRAVDQRGTMFRVVNVQPGDILAVRPSEGSPRSKHDRRTAAGAGPNACPQKSEARVAPEAATARAACALPPTPVDTRPMLVEEPRHSICRDACALGRVPDALTPLPALASIQCDAKHGLANKRGHCYGPPGGR